MMSGGTALSDSYSSEPISLPVSLLWGRCVLQHLSAVLAPAHPAWLHPAVRSMSSIARPTVGPFGAQK